MSPCIARMEGPRTPLLQTGHALPPVRRLEVRWTWRVMHLQQYTCPQGVIAGCSIWSMHNGHILSRRRVVIGQISVTDISPVGSDWDTPFWRLVYAHDSRKLNICIDILSETTYGSIRNMVYEELSFSMEQWKMSHRLFWRWSHHTNTEESINK